MKNYNFFEILHLDNFCVNLLIMITFWSILALSEGFGKSRNPKWLPSYNMALLWCHLTSSVDDADLKRNVAETIPTPGPRKPKRSLVWMGSKYLVTEDLNSHKFDNSRKPTGYCDHAYGHALRQDYKKRSQKWYKNTSHVVASIPWHT